jgi:hypothetical protein
MADIVIIVQSIGATDNGDQLAFSCSARCSTMDVYDATLTFDALASPSALPTTINAAIKAAGVAAAGDAGFTVGLLDSKTLVGAAVGL